MSLYVLPDTVNGGIVQVQGSSLAEAQQNAAQQTGVSLSQQQGGGTFGSQSVVNTPGSVNTTGGGGGSPSALSSGTAARLDQIQQQVNQAITSGNKAAFDEAVRQFNATFGLDTQKFQEAVNEYNRSFPLSESAITGLYQGLPTQAAQQQQANIAAQTAGLTGVYTPPPAAGGFTPPTQQQAVAQRQQELIGHGMPAEQAGQTALSEYNQGYLQSGNVAYGTNVAFAPPQGSAQQGVPTLAARQLGLNALQLATQTQANPFRQAEALYGMTQQGLSPLMRSAAGLAGPVPTFQAPTLSAADTRSLNWLSSQGGPGSYTQDQATNWMNALPSPNAVNWTNVSFGTPGAQDLVVKGLAQKYGLNETDIQSIAHATMPAFAAPSLAGSTRF